MSRSSIRILNKLDNPTNYQHWQQQATIQQPRGPVEWMKEFVPGLASEDSAFIKMLINDLQAAGLIAMKGDDPRIDSPFLLPVRGRCLMRMLPVNNGVAHEEATERGNTKRVS